MLFYISKPTIILKFIFKNKNNNKKVWKEWIKNYKNRKKEVKIVKRNNFNK